MKTKLIQKIKEELKQKILISLNLFAMGVQTGNIYEEEKIFTERITNQAMESFEKAISQSKEELVEEIKKFKKESECPLYVCCDDCYKLTIQDILDHLEDLNKK